MRSCNLLTGLEAVLQADAAVEYQMAGCGVLAVGAEIAQTHELEAHGSLGACKACFHLTAGEDFQRVGVQAGEVILAGGIGIGIIEELCCFGRHAF